MYDPRREARRQLARVPLPDDVDPRDLDAQSRRQLMSLSKDTADIVARHLVMAGRLMDTEPVQALAHARAARALAGRVGAVREANGLVAYTAGEWTEALSELRAARRMTGEPQHLAVMADCERALGRPDRALLVVDDPQAKALDPAAKVELMIVASGARRDLGEFGSAVALLQVPALEGPVRPWTARLRYAFADALLDSGREDEAREWFARAAEVDEAGETDAEERVLELDGMIFHDLEDSEDDTFEAVAGEVERAPEAPDQRSHVLEIGAHVDSPGEPRPAGEAPAVEPAAQAAEEPAVETVESPELYGRPAYRSPVVQDEEIPALGRAGSTALGFLAPPDGAEEPERVVETGVVESRAASEALAPQDGDGEDDLRLFD